MKKRMSRQKNIMENLRARVSCLEAEELISPEVAEILNVKKSHIYCRLLYWADYGDFH